MNDYDKIFMRLVYDTIFYRIVICRKQDWYDLKRFESSIFYVFVFDWRRELTVSVNRFEEQFVNNSFTCLKTIRKCIRRFELQQNNQWAKTTFMYNDDRDSTQNAYCFR